MFLKPNLRQLPTNRFLLLDLSSSPIKAACAVEFTGGNLADCHLESLHLATIERKVEFQSKKLQAEIDELDKTIEANGAEIMRIATENQAKIQKKNERLAKLNK